MSKHLEIDRLQSPEDVFTTLSHDEILSVWVEARQIIRSCPGWVKPVDADHIPGLIKDGIKEWSQKSPTDSWNFLQKAAASENPEHRALVVETLPNITDQFPQEAIQLYGQLLNDNNPEVRGQAAVGFIESLLIIREGIPQTYNEMFKMDYTANPESRAKLKELTDTASEILFEPPSAIE